MCHHLFGVGPNRENSRHRGRSHNLPACQTVSVWEDPPWSEQYLRLGFTKSDDRICPDFDLLEFHMKVIKLAQVPPPVVSAAGTVVEAVRIMQGVRVGAAAVLDGDQLVGIFSERDVMLRVVGAGKDPGTTLVSDVMTTDLERATGAAESGDALELMVEKHIRHLPIVDTEDKLVGLLSIRNLLQHHVDDLVDQLNSLEAYFSADGPGG